MPHISRIGRKSWGARFAFLMMYILLTLGGVTMVVPFLIMFSNSFKSSIDGQTFDLLPNYWFNQQMLTKKYVEQQCNYDMAVYNAQARANIALVTDMPVPTVANSAQHTDYCAFLKELPVNYTMMTNRGPLPPRDFRYFGIHQSVLDYRKAMLAKYGTRDKIQDAYGTVLPDNETLAPPAEAWQNRAYLPLVDTRMADYLEFKKTLPADQLIPVAAEFTWITYLRTKSGLADIKAINDAYGTDYEAIETATMPLRVPKDPEFAKAWEDCVRHDMPIWFIRADATARDAWTKFLAGRFKGNPALYQRAHPQTHYASFAQIPLPAEISLEDTVAMGEWNDFLNNKNIQAPVGSLYLDTPEERYRTYLQTKFADIAAVNAAYGTTYAEWAAILPPSVNAMALEAQTHSGAVRWAFISRNYRSVTNFMLLHGRAFLNTAVYIFMALFFTLTVNPITAYALSRFKLKSTNKLLLFLLATMAFPAEIAMIPNFLLLRDLHLLNTFWALVLPGMANGFSIFLLKGMFDGLPQDLYEAAELDGASEPVIFWRITMPLVKPFLAYLSLGTFTGAYAAFAFAFILCPNPKMWTIMVYLQQMDWASQPVKFAAFVLASIPTLIVFITAQRVIMQGIVLPTER